MTFVQSFSCPACNRGEFRSLPGPDGKAFCPWCGGAVGGGVAPSAPPEPAPVPAAAPPAEDVAEWRRRCEAAESELQRERERRDGIKKAVGAELGRLTAQLGEAQGRLGNERAAAVELATLKDELAAERKRTTELSAVRALLEEKEKAAKALEAELAETRKVSRGHQDALETARHQGEQQKVEAVRLKAMLEADQNLLRKAVGVGDERLRTLQKTEGELRETKARRTEEIARLDKESGQARAKLPALQAELEKRDQRIRELQMLIKTLGERLNDLSSRPPR